MSTVVLPAQDCYVAYKTRQSGCLSSVDDNKEIFPSKRNFRKPKIASKNTDFRHFSAKEGSFSSPPKPAMQKLESHSDQKPRILKNGYNGIKFTSSENRGRRNGQNNKKQQQQLVMENITILKRGEMTKATNGEGEKEKGHDEKMAIDKKWVSHRSEVQEQGRSVNTKDNECNFDDELGVVFDDLVITSTDPIGPDPSVLPRHGSSGILHTVSSEVKVDDSLDVSVSPKCVRGYSSSSFGYQVGSPPINEKWAGPAYSNSPPPSSLPLPKFSVQIRSISAELNDDSQDASISIVRGFSIHKGSNVSIPAVRSCVNPVQSGVDASATRDLRRLLGLERRINCELTVVGRTEVVRAQCLSDTSQNRIR